MGLSALFTLPSVSVVTSTPCPPHDTPKVTLSTSPALELHRSCSRGAVGPPAAPQGWLQWDLVSGRSHEGAPGTRQRRGRNARSRACISCRIEERCKEQSSHFLQNYVFSSISGAGEQRCHSSDRGGAGSASAFVPVTYMVTSSSAHIAVCPTQGLREAVVWAVLA